MKKLSRTILLSSLILVCGCKSPGHKKPMGQAEMVSYAGNPENGLKKTEQVGQVKAVLTYKPWQLLATRRHSEKPDQFDFKDKLFFVLSLSANNKEVLRQLEFSKYSEMVQVLAFRMNEFIKAIPEGGKQVEPLECIFQQTYGMGVENEVLIVFNRKQLMNGNTFNINVKEFGLNTGNLNFEYKTKDIDHIQ